MKRIMKFVRAFSAPKIRLPKFAMPKFAMPKSRKLVIAASVLALIVAGGLAWFIVRPMLTGPRTAAPETVAVAKVGEPAAPERAQTPGKDEKPAGLLKKFKKSRK